MYMGTPEFAVPPLRSLIESGENVQAVFTQPDKPKGRGLKMSAPPVKVMAMAHHIPVYQPESLKSGAGAELTAEVLKRLSPDLIIVAAYGKILPLSVLEAPKLHCINIHASLLPKYRGAAPIQRCIMDGEKVTGITTMLMAEGLDTGDMLLKSETEIGENETASELHDRLAQMGATLLTETLKGVKNNFLKPVKQEDSLSSYAPMITKDMCPIDFSRPVWAVHNHIRGLSSFPCATVLIKGKRLKIFKSVIRKDLKTNQPPGTAVNPAKLEFACGDGGVIAFTELQPDGGRRMKASDYLRGNPIFP